MKKLLLLSMLVWLSAHAQAQWNVTTLGLTGDTVTFDTTFVGVNNGAFTGTGLQASPSVGMLDSDGWIITGLSDGNTTLGGTFTSGDYARGVSAGGVSSGGIYAFVVAAGDTAVGVQPTGSDFSPGDFVLMVINNTGFDADSFSISYDLVVYNNEERGNSFDFGYGVNDSSNFTFVSALEYTSTITSQTTPVWDVVSQMAGIVASINDGDTLFLAWNSDDDGGSGSRDEFALNNISVTLDTGSVGSNPPVAAIPEYPIATINTVDANGVADSLGVYCWTRGVVVGIDYDGNDGYSFTIMDTAGGISGINVYSPVDTSGYVVVEGDSIRLRGDIDQYNGLTEFVPDSIVLLNQSNPLPDTVLVTSLSEATESELVMIEDLIITSIQTFSSAANYTLTSTAGTFVMRVDYDTDVEDSLSFAVGDSLCWVVGIGGQFDGSSPYDDGYQIFPRYYTDIDTTCGGAITPPPPPTVPEYPIADINNDDSNGEPDSIGVYCWTSGVVLGVDLDGNNGLSFTLWDDEGINIFNFNDVSNYVVTEGDSLRVRGEIDFYNGLTELFVDSIVLLNTGNPIPTETEVPFPSATTESNPIVIKNVYYVAGSNTWPEPGFFSTNVMLHNCVGDTMIMRMDSDTDIDENWFSDSTVMMTIRGIGGQFDNSAPYTDGYQIFPMEINDFDTASQASITGLMINELMADNASTIQDEHGDFDDWIELYNPGSSSISLAGLYVTNDAADPMKYQVPVSSSESVAAGGYALIWADNESNEGDLHTNFELDASGGEVWIGSMAGCTAMGLDSIQYTVLGTDESYGREEDGASEWMVFGVGTPNAMNEILSVGSITSSSLKAWPNPNNGGQLYFNELVSFKLINLTGQAVMTASRVNDIDLSNLDRGMYLIETSNGETLRIIVE